MAEHDLVIRGGTIVDGTGTDPFTGDIAIDGNKISEVGKVTGKGKREIDAKGLMVTPGFVDIHTHYDAQATWDPYLTPSSQHGVTTVVMGNCGVGFAPVKPESRDELIDLMEAVEDIPGAAMHEGIKWEWESFPEYMDALDKRSYAVDIGAQMPHCSLRVYVMGQRGIDNEPATPEDIAKMRDLTYESLKAGALGFSTSRTDLHNTLQGDPVPGTLAATDELFGIADALKAYGGGVFQIAATHREMEKEFDWMLKMAKDTGRMVTFQIQQIDEAPDLYQKMLDHLDEARAEGVTNIRGQHSGRPVGLLMGWQTSVHPFIGFPEYRPYAEMPFKERLEKLKDPAVRAEITGGKNVDKLGDFGTFITTSFHKMYPMGEKENYEPAPEDSIAAIAEREGKTPAEVAYDAMMLNDGQAMLYFPLFGYSTNDYTAIEATLRHPQTGLSLADGGAHVGAICDGGTPTFMLTHWARDRSRGAKMPIQDIIRIQTKDTAEQYGLYDRGVLKPGMKADVNVIDFENLTFTHPEMRFDLPAGGRRLWQGAKGYRATILSGVVVSENDEPTGNLPGHLIRGEQAAPAA
ncbi:amidohydrolase family protein [Parvibaculum sp.]|uniref:N-acyl-D-amino-acid deacylase family protein n=1 Tax=Parvibaculum sp. TaxID=2024848 RepID=UPI000C9229AB|nr:amidohydrolase family protein [Parvibaculum sp.]MAB12514.1 amidohydrolase [Parvibaculum sp.]